MMTPDEKMPTIRKDLADVYRLLCEARSKLHSVKQHQIYDPLDRAVAILEGLGGFIGPWTDEEIAGRRGLVEAD